MTGRLFSLVPFSILGGDVFVLQIVNVTHNDTGLYVCEVNTDPPLRSFHRLSVLTDTLVAPAPHPASDEHTYVYFIWYDFWYTEHHYQYL